MKFFEPKEALLITLKRARLTVECESFIANGYASTTMEGNRIAIAPIFQSKVKEK